MLKCILLYTKFTVMSLNVLLALQKVGEKNGGCNVPFVVQQLP